MLHRSGKDMSREQNAGIFEERLEISRSSPALDSKVSIGQKETMDMWHAQLFPSGPQQSQLQNRVPE